MELRIEFMNKYKVLQEKGLRIVSVVKYGNPNMDGYRPSYALPYYYDRNREPRLIQAIAVKNLEKTLLYFDGDYLYHQDDDYPGDMTRWYRIGTGHYGGLIAVRKHIDIPTDVE